MSWFNRMSVGKKLFCSFSFLLVLMLVMGSVAIWKMASLNENADQIAKSWLPGVIAASEINRDLNNYRAWEYTHLTSEDPKEMAEAEKMLADLKANMEEKLQAAKAATSGAKETELLESMGQAMAGYFAETDKWMPLSKANKNDEAEEVLKTSSRELSETFRDLARKEVTLNAEGADKEVEQAISAYQTGRNVTLIILGINVVLGIGIATWISRWFTRAIVEVDDISASVASASQQLAAASEQLSSGAQQSASSLEETASSLEEITATVRQNADNADQANQLANNSRETAEKGGAVVANAVTAMGEINQASRKIADIITTIDEIAFQTNLLALNAAVEAARAGEQGRGFAVVAGEVRNLAQRSASAAREIKTLIEDSVDKVEVGSNLVNKSGETLEEIVTSVKRVTDIVAEIAAASREQTSGIEQINKAVAQMDQVTQSNASQTEEMSGTAVSLSEQAEQLKVVVSQFNLNRETINQAPKSKPRNLPSHEPSYTSRSNGTAKKQYGVVKSAVPRREEMDLVGAGMGHDGFEEF
ncbi:methyl-accepting chemotaxis protein [Bremerella cremea]|uniref:Methyl-accepting chemotaxis protein n=1 Tax=Bremerella cremea TaxID=1031537 RepID=A0A368KWQ2_9BACT|nr:methyl-accepting chemotaxis protein [Bremerella cremea]RCS53904.1 methyl-accepting chemotaxis protein [Bremerella cremea]